MFKKHDVRYEVDGRELRRRRLDAGVTLTQFAAECGWSPAYQSRLERDLVGTISGATKNVLEGALITLLKE